MSVSDVAGPYRKAWAARDVDAVVALHTTESVFHVHGFADAASGVEAVRQLVDSFFTLVPDLQFDAKRVYVGADHIVFEYEMAGTADGSPFRCDGVDVIAVSAGLVARKDTYLDLTTLQRQVGRLPSLIVGATAASE